MQLIDSFKCVWWLNFTSEAIYRRYSNLLVEDVGVTLSLRIKLKWKLTRTVTSSFSGLNKLIFLNLHFISSWKQKNQSKAAKHNVTGAEWKYNTVRISSVSVYEIKTDMNRRQRINNFTAFLLHSLNICISFEFEQCDYIYFTGAVLLIQMCFSLFISFFCLF